MTTVKAYAAHESGAEFQPYEFQLGEIGADQVDIAVETCGLCHSDLSMLDNEWGLTQYPLVPGHEVIGKVSQVGADVAHVKVGDRVGLGWQCGYCLTCGQCLSGEHNLCPEGQETIVGRHGGFADTVRASAAAVLPIPDALNAADAGPLLCGGITVFNPFLKNNIPPTANVGIIGIGGLGHMAVKFARAWGCHVTAFTFESQLQEAIDLGAHDTVISNDPEAVKAAAGRFDMVLSTINVNIDWNAILATLRPHGRLHMVGIVVEPLQIALFPMIKSQLALSGSPVGSPTTMRTMLDFAARHNIAPVTEHYPMSQINEAVERLRANKARYRIILDR